jgi:hypothetical protein
MISPLGRTDVSSPRSIILARATGYTCTLETVAVPVRSIRSDSKFILNASALLTAKNPICLITESVAGKCKIAVVGFQLMNANLLLIRNCKLKSLLY